MKLSHSLAIAALAFAALASSITLAADKKKVVFIAGRPSHGYGAHEHNAGCDLLARSLKQAEPDWTVEVVHNGWPKETAVLDKADCIVMYCDGGGGHMVVPHLKEVDAMAKKGTGVVCIHYAVEVEKDKGGKEFLDWMGGYFETNWSVNPHWVAKFDKLPEHPITRGVEPFATDDEWYYHMRFREGMKGVTPILTAMPPKETLNRGDGTHSGNPAVRKAVLEDKEPQHVAWASENEGGGRGFGCTGGHNHWNWGDTNFRKLVLNAIVWCAHGEVPKNGISDKQVSVDDLVNNQDEPTPANINREDLKKKFNLSGDAGKKEEPKKDGASSKPAPKAKFTSKTVTADIAGGTVAIEVDIKGAKQLYLVVSDAGDGFGCDWADWAEPKLVGPSGEKKLTDLKMKSAQAGFGSVNVNKNCRGSALKIAGKNVDFGIGTHANSVIAYELPEGYEKFTAKGGIDDGGSNQGCGSTVVFAVYTENPGELVASAGGGGGGGQAGANDPKRSAENAVANLDAGEGLEASLFSSEPQISNVTNIDIDHLGRVWVAEVKNYRKWNGSRPEGDRILVLEDTDLDGKSDKETVFYQGKDIDSVHGICVLGNRVIVSAGDKVQVFYDDNNDLKSDRKEVLFSGIGGTQHDHGIHAFVFGPDGKLYFNFGNSGGQIKDKDGKTIVDLSGLEVTSHGKPYRQGMVFRCNLDGSQFETLAWNFRNNWEVTVDSFGTMWQSDNDDDGNKGVRINYVMDYGNYGYQDEITGAGWNQNRTNMEKEIPLRHWHLNDPGVVPNLLQTGAGSPTGICVYEGTLLPKKYQNQVIHCDAGPSVCRAYITTKDGAGYKAEIANVLVGTRDNWYRPSDVCVAPDGSLFISDWYDPGVGGHNQQEVDKGRIFRVAPPGSKYSVPKFDFTTAAGALAALKNPNLSVRYMAFTALKNMDDEKSAEAIHDAYKASDDPRYKARLGYVGAAWLMAHRKELLPEMLGSVIKDGSNEMKIVALRIARECGQDLIPYVSELAKSDDAAVLRECAIALRHSKAPEAPDLWAQLASKYDGKDRWYLEALGIGADKNWDTYLDAYLSKAGDKAFSTDAGKDLIWRSRGKKTPELLVKVIKDKSTTKEQQPKFMRAFDFQPKSAEKDKALQELLLLE
jgi:putative membrane-bound dehydrogenase-like protein